MTWTIIKYSDLTLFSSELCSRLSTRYIIYHDLVNEIIKKCLTTTEK